MGRAQPARGYVWRRRAWCRTPMGEYATAQVCVCYPWKRKEASIGVLYLPASDAKDDLVSITMR